MSPSPLIFGCGANQENSPPSGKLSCPWNLTNCIDTQFLTIFQIELFTQSSPWYLKVSLQPFPGVDQHQFVQVRTRVNLRGLDQAAVLIQKASGDMKQRGAGMNI